MTEITYDIQNKTYLTGVSRGNGDNYEAVSNMQLDERDENQNQMLRSISSAWANLRLALRKYMNIPAESSDNILIDDHEDITINLEMPNNFNESNSTSLAALFHQYIVNYSIADWFGITNKEDAAIYANAASESMTLIQRTINDRSRPARPHRRGCMCE